MASKASFDRIDGRFSPIAPFEATTDRIAAVGVIQANDADDRCPTRTEQSKSPGRRNNATTLLAYAGRAFPTSRIASPGCSEAVTTVTTASTADLCCHHLCWRLEEVHGSCVVGGAVGRLVACVATTISATAIRGHRRRRLRGASQHGCVVRGRRPEGASHGPQAAGSMRSTSGTCLPHSVHRALH